MKRESTIDLECINVDLLMRILFFFFFFLRGKIIRAKNKCVHCFENMGIGLCYFFQMNKKKFKLNVQNRETDI